VKKYEHDHTEARGNVESDNEIGQHRKYFRRKIKSLGDLLNAAKLWIKRITHTIAHERKCERGYEKRPSWNKK
jgi:hypothetical protein